MEVFKLFGSIMVNNDSANKSIDNTDKKAGGLGATLGKGIGTAVKWGAGLVAAAGAGAVALFGVATKAAESTDRIDKLSQKIGLSKKGFQEWDFIMSQSGASVEDLQSGFKTFTKQIDEASKGTKLSAGYFKDLGVSINDNNGKMKSQEQLFNETVIALQKMEEGPKKAALANNLLGKSASELAPLINGAVGSVEEMRKKANELGLVLSDDAIAAGVKFTDSVDQMKRSMGALVTNVGTDVMPIMQGMLEWFTAHMPQIKNVSKIAFDVIGSIVKTAGGFITNTLVPAFKSLYDWIQPHIPAIKETVRIAFDVIKTIIKGVSDFVTTYVLPIFVSLKDWFVANWPKIKDAVMQAYNYIKPSFDELVATIKANVMPIIMGLWDTVKRAMPGIQAIFKIVFPILVFAVKTVIDIVTDVIKVIKGIYDFIKPGLDLVADLFSTVFGGIQKVIEGVQWVLDIFNGTKMQDKSSTITTNRVDNYSSGKMLSSHDNTPKNAEGTDYWRGGLTRINELGGEIINLPRGSQIIPNDISKIMAKNGNTGGSNGGLTLYIQNLYNNRKQDVEELMQEAEMYRQMHSKAIGGT